MSTWASLKSSDYITAEEFDGKDVTIRLVRFDKQDFERDDNKGEGGKKHERVGVAYFAGSERGWVLNATNIILLAAMFASPDDAVGHRVTLRAESVKFGRDQVLGIRVIGSPELEKPMEVEVKLPRRKPIKRMLVPTSKTTEEPALAQEVEPLTEDEAAVEPDADPVILDDEIPFG